MIFGPIEADQPSAGAAAAAEQLPHGRYVEVSELDHFGPFTDPARVAALVAAPSLTICVRMMVARDHRPDVKRGSPMR